MCRYNKLHQNKYGYVIECKKCMHIQVAFGTSCLTFSPKQFNDFISEVDKLDKAKHYYEFPEQKTIIIPTGADRVNMICSATELKQLKQLILKGRSSLEMAKLFIFYAN